MCKKGTHFVLCFLSHQRTSYGQKTDKQNKVTKATEKDHTGTLFEAAASQKLFRKWLHMCQLVYHPMHKIP